MDLNELTNDGSSDLDALIAGIEVPEEMNALADEVLESLADDDAPIPGEEPPAPEIVIDKEAIYSSQSSKLDVASDEEAAPKKGSKGKSRKGKKTASAAATGDKDTKDDAGAPITAPVTSRATRSAAFEKRASRSDLEALGYEPDDVQGLLDAMDSAPKKVSEKAYNLLRFAVGREHLSNYTRFTLEQLEGGKAMTVPQLVKAMEDRGYRPGTARSQSQQMSRLLRMFGMAPFSGLLTLNEDSPLTKAVLGRLAVMKAGRTSAPSTTPEAEPEGDDLLAEAA